MLFPDVPYVPPECREPTRPRVWLPQSIVTKVQRLPPSPTRMVALVIDDGRVVEDVELSQMARSWHESEATPTSSSSRDAWPTPSIAAEHVRTTRARR
jgi:hypothetical protein